MTAKSSCFTQGGDRCRPGIASSHLPHVGPIDEFLPKSFAEVDSDRAQHQTHYPGGRMPQTSDTRNQAGSTRSLPIEGSVTVMFLRLRAVMQVTGLSRSTLYRLISNQSFPRPVRLGPRAVAWRREDIDAWGRTRCTAPH